MAALISPEIFNNLEYHESVSGRNFPVQIYQSPAGYPYDCSYCKNKPATWRYEIYDHLYQPQGSEYFCGDCRPQPTAE